MKNEEFTIELVGRATSAALPDARLAKRARSGLSGHRFFPSGWVFWPGRPTSAQHDDRRMEDWIASHLDLGELSAPRSASPWTKIIENLPGLKRKPKARVDSQVGRVDARFMEVFSSCIQARDHGGAAARESPGQGIADSRAGPRPSRLDRGGQSSRRLEFPGDRAAGELDGLCRRRSRQPMCRAATAVRSRSAVFRLSWRECSRSPASGLGVSIHADEAAAIESPWPACLRAAAAAGRDPLRTHPRRRRSCRFAAARRPRPPISNPLASIEDESFLDGSNLPAAVKRMQVWLRVQIGAAKGRAIAIYGPKFVIGRDRNCHLRLGSAMVSKLHAAIELREGRIFVRDLGSTNGTIVDGRTLRDAETEIHDGDRIQIGPAVCTLSQAHDKARGRPGREDHRRLAARRRQRLPSLSRRKPADDFISHDR